MSESSTDYDNPWKDILEAYFEDFIAFFFPHIHADIDWSKGYTFLDKELQQVVQDAELGKRFADKLVKVWKVDGQETWVLCHIEIQSQEEANFPHRMFVCNYRLRDCYNRPVASLAILGDERLTWRPQTYQDELWNCRISFEFPIVKLLDYAKHWSDLESSHNPFAWVVMAHLKTKETTNDRLQRKEWKFRLMRQLYEAGYERQDILNLYRFIDWLMRLPIDLEYQFKEQLDQYEQERQMPYVTSIERMGIEKGREEERKEIAKRLLLQGLPMETIAQATDLTLEQIQLIQLDQER